MRWLRRIAIAFGVLLVLLALGLWWVLGTGAGLRFALARAQGFTSGALTVQQARGSLAGAMDLDAVRYRIADGADVRIAHAHLQLQLWPLLTKRVHVVRLSADGVAVRLPEQPAPAQPSSGFSLTPPVDLLLDSVQVSQLAITRGAVPLFVANRLDLAGSWTAEGLMIRQLALRAPQGHADVQGRLAFGAQLSGDGGASFAWKQGDIDYAGSLSAHGDGSHSQAVLALNAPTAARLQLNLTQNAASRWSATLAVPRFNPTPLLGPGKLTALALDLHGSGDRQDGSISGTVGLNDYQLLLQPLRAHFSDGHDTLNIEQLALASPQIKGNVQIGGTVHLAAQPVNGALTIGWNGLQLPPELVGQPLVSDGQLSVDGSTARFHADGKLRLGPPGQLTDLALNLDGTPQQIALHTLDLRQPQGGLQAHGTLTLKPALAWQLDATAQRFNPGQLFAGWNGSLDAQLSTHGTLPQDRPDITLAIDKLAGTLRGRAVRGSGALHLAPSHVLDGTLKLASGRSSLAVIAKPGVANAINLQLAIASLADWRSDANGRLDGHFNVRGLWPKLAVDGTLQGSALAWQQQTVERLALEAHVPDISQLGGKLDLTAQGVHASGLAFQQLAVHGDGTSASHRLTLAVRGSQLSGQLALEGSLQKSRWHGTLSQLEINPRGLPRWRLQQPAALTYAAGAMTLSELCLSAGEPLLCIKAKRDAAGALDASYRLHALPLAMLLNAAGYAKTPLAASGELQGQGAVHRSAVGALSGNASLRSPQGSVIYSDHADRPLLAWHDLGVNADLSPGRQQLSLQASLDHGGRIDGQIALSGDAKALAGQLAVHLNSLAPIELFTAELANVGGQLDGQFDFAGTLQQPRISGQATINGFAAEIPTAGIKLTNGRLVASTNDAREFQLDGRVQSGKGTLALQGIYGLGAGAQTTITLKGQAFTAADIPAVHVVLSPDLVVKKNANGIDVGGAVTLDSAEADLSHLPGGGGIKASPDVVVVDEKQQEQAKAQLPLSARIKVDLGHQTHVVGKGVDGRLTGVLTVIERPGHSTTAEGQVTVNGTYKAYGQNLTIQRGQLLFASTPIDNPGLNIRAVRKLNPNATIDEGQEVGLLVTGTAQSPTLTVFSNPPMEQSDALAYLITGKPLSQVNSGEGNTITTAAQALGSAAGNLLAKRVGAKLGIDDIGVSSSEALGGSSAFTVGKYLSPRLYLSYGVGLFAPGQVITLRYRLNQRWNIEAENATDFSRASLNYRIER